MMPNKVTLIDLRNWIEEALNEARSERPDSEIANSDVLTRVKASKTTEIAALTPQLIDIALTKLLNDVSSRKGAKALTNEGYDLFSGYRGIPKNVVLSKNRRKGTPSITLREADEWLTTHTLPVSTKRNEALKRLIEDCRPYFMAAEDTLEIAMKRKLEADHET